jgi:hypothetical protein
MATVISSALPPRSTLTAPPAPAIPRLMVGGVPRAVLASPPVAAEAVPRGPGRSGLAVASLGLVLSIPVLAGAGFFHVVPRLLTPPVLVAAILFGHFARMQIARHPGMTGRAVATTGLVIGYGYISLAAIGLLALALFFPSLFERLLNDIKRQGAPPPAARWFRTHPPGVWVAKAVDFR